MGLETERLLQQHFSLLPSKPHLRNGNKAGISDDDAACSVNFGAFIHSGILGCHKMTTTHPWSAMLWASVVRSVDDGHYFTTVSVARNTVSTLHTDVNNQADLTTW